MMMGMMNIKMTIIKEVHLPRYERGSSFDVLPHRFAPDNERFQDQEITINLPVCLKLDLNHRKFANMVIDDIITKIGSKWCLNITK